MSGSKAKVRKALQLEVDRLEELKMQNMKKVIEAIRVELVQYWDQCFYSQEQRQAFAPFYAEDYTENLLQLHDAEIVQLKTTMKFTRNSSKVSRSGKKPGGFS